ncbi:MAG: glycoside hydrolase family 20 zincin-like fold domain-containing protein, partial [Planctomycetaceae bacterium]|nr:glycoside hydrolase family 20 zincin-like fold domain-containing protein [Planctomycetaceae bacterium]
MKTANKLCTTLVCTALVILSAIVLPAFSAAQDHSAVLRLVPYPKNVEVQAGQFLDLNVPLQLTVSQKHKDVLAGAVTEELKRIGLPEPKIVVSEDNLRIILTSQQVGMPATIPVSSEHPEAYTLTVTKNGIVCQGKTEAGLYYAVQTLRQ